MSVCDTFDTSLRNCEIDFRDVSGIRYPARQTSQFSAVKFKVPDFCQTLLYIRPQRKGAYKEAGDKQLFESRQREKDRGRLIIVRLLNKLLENKLPRSKVSQIIMIELIVK